MSNPSRQLNEKMAKTIPPKQLDRLLRERKVVDQKTLNGEIFRGQKWPDFVAIGSSFKSCDFSNVRIEQACFGAGMTQSFYTECCFDGAEFYATSPGNVRFDRCTFRGVKIHVFNGMMAEFVDCTISGTIKKGFFNGNPHQNPLIPPPNRKSNEFHGNDFSAAKLLDIGFRTGIDLSQQRLPRGNDYIYVEDGVKFVQNLPTIELTERYGSAFNAIEQVMRRSIAGGQRQIFLSIKGFPSKDRPMLTELKRIAEGTLLA